MALVTIHRSASTSNSSPQRTRSTVSVISLAELLFHYNMVKVEKENFSILIFWIFLVSQEKIIFEVNK